MLEADNNASIQAFGGLREGLASVQDGDEAGHQGNDLRKARATGADFKVQV